MTQNKGLVLTAMVFAVAMTFIDQTIVAIAIPNIERHLSLSRSRSLTQRWSRSASSGVVRTPSRRCEQHLRLLCDKQKSAHTQRSRHDDGSIQTAAPASTNPP